MPLYFKAVSDLPPTEILWHRIIWSSLLTLIIAIAIRRANEITKTFLNTKQVGWLTLSALLIGGNWLLFIWAINNNRMLDASLGYFINPLINMVLGYFFLQERLTKVQLIAAGLAILGVTIQVIAFGQIPWIALGLGLCFGIYGLIRKRISTDALIGLHVETALLIPIVIISIWFHDQSINLFANHTTFTSFLLIMAGPATTLPLLLFVYASRRITLTSIGFIQYIGPSTMFLMAVFIYHEPVGAHRWITFAFIWSALALVTWQAAMQMRQLSR